MLRPVLFALFPFGALLNSFRAGTTAATQTRQIKDLKIPRIASKPRIEEFLDGHSRTDMLRIDYFRQRNPGDGVPVSQKTSAWVAYDDKTLLRSLRLPLGARATPRTAWVSAKIFFRRYGRGFFDTYHDHQRSYEFFVNPLGIQANGIVSENQNDDFSFDTLWYSDGRITSDGFVATISIPLRAFASLRRTSRRGASDSGSGFLTNNESSFWPYITNRVNAFTPQLANMNGLRIYLTWPQSAVHPVHISNAGSLSG